MRRIAVGLCLIVSLILSVGVAGPAAAKPSPIRLASSTPAIDAGGQAAFGVRGLPAANAWLQWFNPTSKKWQNAAKVARKGSVGAAIVSAVPQGINRYRVLSGSRASNSVYVKAYGIYTFSEFNKTHTFGTTTMAARDEYLTSRDLRVPAGFGCELVDMGLELISPQPSWSAQIAALSDAEPDPVVSITQLPTEVPLASVSRATVSGAIDFRFLISSSNSQPFFAWAGIQVHCLANPGI